MSMFNDIELNRAGNEQMRIKQRSTSCRCLQGLQGRSLPPHFAQIRAVLELRLDRIHSRKVGRNCGSDDRHFRTVGTSSFPGPEKVMKGTLKRKGGNATIHVSAEVENVQMLMKLILSCNQLCMYLSVA